jgi:AcrR family transcriptional regulator
VSPRPYQLGLRKAAIDETRERIVNAARELLEARSGVAGFTLDAVAKQAGVARMTVYYQFESKAGLLDALFDHLAARGRIEELRHAFEEPDPIKGLQKLVRTFGTFWGTDRIVTRRIRAIAAIDPEVEKGVRKRDLRRRQALEVLVERIAKTSGRQVARNRTTLVDMLYAITSFETFDSVAGGDRSIEEITPLIQSLATAVLKSPRGSVTRK